MFNDLNNLTNSKLMGNISIINEEIQETKKVLKNIINQPNVPKEEIKNIIKNLRIKNEKLLELNLKLINRNYNSKINYNGKNYNIIELLKIRDKLRQDKEINDIILNRENVEIIKNTEDIEGINKKENEEFLKLTLETFQNNSACKNELNKIFELLDTYNKKEHNETIK